MVILAQVVGNKTSVGGLLGHDAFTHRKHQQVVEVEITRFEHTHHLQARCRFAVEGYRQSTQHLTQQSLQGAQGYLKNAVADIEQEAVDRCITLKVGFGRQLSQPSLLTLLFHFAAGLVAQLLRKSFQHVLIAHLTPSGLFKIMIQAVVHKGIGQGVGHGETFGDVHLLHVLRQSVNHRLQEQFITKHHGRPLLFSRQVAFEPVGGKGSLCRV